MTPGLLDNELTAPELAAVAAIWKHERRLLSTSFGGTSMLPSIAPGQPVRVQCGQTPKLGDVVVYRHAQQLRVHRVVARSGSQARDAWFLTWGDNNPLPDTPTGAEHVIGVVVGVPVRPSSAARRVVLWLLVGQYAASANLVWQVQWRVAWLYRLRAAWLAGPRAIATKAVRAWKRRGSPC